MTAFKDHYLQVTFKNVWPDKNPFSESKIKQVLIEIVVALNPHLNLVKTCDSSNSQLKTLDHFT